MYWGALFGGSITSILFNIPGEPSSVATTFDGYPMAREGRAAEALTAAFSSALIGALAGVLLLTFLSTKIAAFAMSFSSPEFFAVYLLAFCTFIGMSKNPPLKTVVAMMIGFAMAAAGTDTAIETADVALMDDDLRNIPAFVRLSRQSAAILMQNIVLALGIKAIFLAITFAGMATMWMAVFADMGVSLLVVFNGLRLLRK
ncbi:cadmium-translocating P-type ATPase [compost metagenome]